MVMNKLSFKVIAGIIITLGLCLTGQNLALALTNQQSIIIPGYSYPGSRANTPYWNKIFSHGAGTSPMIVVNPGNGPVDNLDANYIALKNKLDIGGYKTLGYITTDEQTKDLNAAKAEVDKWHTSWNGIKGFFLDEVKTVTSEQLCYIANLYNYIKSRNPQSIIIINRGTKINVADFLKYGDIFITSENYAERYINDTSRWTNRGMTEFEKNPANSHKIYHIVHSVNTPEDHARVLELSKERNAGWIYMTSDGGSNPYNDPSIYFDQMVSSTSMLPTPSIISNGMVPLPDSCDNRLGLVFNDSGSGNTDINVNVSSVTSVSVNNLAEMQITPVAGANRVSTDDITATVSTNNLKGYTLNISSKTADTNLVGPSQNIQAHNGTLAAPSNLGNNTWGYRVDRTGGFGDGPTMTETNVADSAFSWAGITTTPQVIRSKNAPITNDNLKIWFGAKVDSNYLSGTYVNTVLLTVVNNF